MAEHSPGPWTAMQARKSSSVSPKLGVFWESYIAVGSGNTGNALAVVVLGGKGGLNASREAVEANARLIAAAPKMLADHACFLRRRGMSEEEVANELIERYSITEESACVAAAEGATS